MSVGNVVKEIGHGIKVAAVDIAKFLVNAPAIIAKFGAVLEAEKAVEPELVTAGKALLADALTFESAAAKAVSDKGLVWSEDTAAIAAAERLRVSVPAFVIVLEKAVTVGEAAAK